MAGNWIAGAIGKPGALHEDLGIPQGQKIPAGRLAAAAKQKGVVGQRARLAQTLEGLHHGSSKSKKPRKSRIKHAATLAVTGNVKAAESASKPKFGSPAWDAKYGIKRFGEK